MALPFGVRMPPPICRDMISLWKIDPWHLPKVGDRKPTVVTNFFLVLFSTWMPRLIYFVGRCRYFGRTWVRLPLSANPKLFRALLLANGNCFFYFIELPGQLFDVRFDGYVHAVAGVKTSAETLVHFNVPAVALMKNGPHYPSPGRVDATSSKPYSPLTPYLGDFRKN